MADRGRRFLLLPESERLSLAEIDEYIKESLIKDVFGTIDVIAFYGLEFRYSFDADDIIFVIADGRYPKRPWTAKYSFRSPPGGAMFVVFHSDTRRDPYYFWAWVEDEFWLNGRTAFIELLIEGGALDIISFLREAIVELSDRVGSGTNIYLSECLTEIGRNALFFSVEPDGYRLREAVPGPSHDVVLRLAYADGNEERRSRRISDRSGASGGALVD